MKGREPGLAHKIDFPFRTFLMCFRSYLNFQILPFLAVLRIYSVGLTHSEVLALHIIHCLAESCCTAPGYEATLAPNVFSQCMLKPFGYAIASQLEHASTL